MKSLSQRGYVFTQLSEAYRMVGSLAQLGTGGKNYKELKKLNTYKPNTNNNFKKALQN